MIHAYKPALAELWFREQLLADEATMSYNRAWGGTIAFPPERWERWYAAWMQAPVSQRYYRYLYDTELQTFVGEIAYHYDAQQQFHLCDVLISAAYRHHGFGTQGLRLLCQAAKENNIPALYDDIAADNPSYQLFLKNGFELVSQNEFIVLVRQIL